MPIIKKKSALLGKAPKKPVLSFSSDSESDDCKSSIKKNVVSSAALSKGPKTQMPADARTKLNNEWPESDALKERLAAGRTGPGADDSKNTYDSKAALAKMDEWSEWPSHESVKERLSAGTITKPTEKPEEPKPKSAAAKLFENVEIAEWPEMDTLKERHAAGRTGAGANGTPKSAGQKFLDTAEIGEWPANEAVK